MNAKQDTSKEIHTKTYYSQTSENQRKILKAKKEKNPLQNRPTTTCWMEKPRLGSDMIFSRSQRELVDLVGLEKFILAQLE